VPTLDDPLLVPVHQMFMHRMGSSGCPYEISDLWISVPAESELASRQASLTNNKRGTGQIRIRMEDRRIKDRRGTGQIREEVKEDENGIGIADARGLSSEVGEGAG
jgi:hypothetical protein